MPFSKGDPNINRKGRPKKGTTITDGLRLIGKQVVMEEKARKKLESILPEGTKITYNLAVAYALMMGAIKGDGPAQRLVLQYLDGLPVQRIEGDIGLSRLSEEELKERIHDRIEEIRSRLEDGTESD